MRYAICKILTCALSFLRSYLKKFPESENAEAVIQHCYKSGSPILTIDTMLVIE